MQQADRPLSEIDAALSTALATAFADHALTASPKDSWQQQVEVKRATAPSPSEFNKGTKPSAVGRAADAACARVAFATR